MLLKIELIYLSPAGNGRIDHTQEFYIHSDSMSEPYEFAKDLPEDVRIYFKGATAEICTDDDKYIAIIRLPYHKPVKLALLQEDEYEEEVYVEYLKHRLSIRFKLICKYEDVFDTLKVRKGQETIEYSECDFASGEKDFLYPNWGGKIPWLEGYQVEEFENDQVIITNRDKSVNFRLYGEEQLTFEDQIEFRLTSTITRINELDPVTKELRVYHVDTDLYNNSFDDEDSAYRLALEIERQTPDALEIIAQYMDEAAELDSVEARQWLEEHRQKLQSRQCQ